MRDQIEIGRFYFQSGELVKSIQQFEQVARLAAADRDPFIEADAYALSRYCALAAGDTAEALRLTKLAADRGSDPDDTAAIPENDPITARFVALYPPFMNAVKRYNELLRKDGDANHVSK